MKAQIKKGFYFLFSVVLFSLFSGCDELEELLEIRTVIYSLEYTNVDMSGMTNTPSNNTMIHYMDAEGYLVPIDLVAPKKTWTQAVFLSKGDRADVQFNAAMNIDSGTATLRIDCDNCKNDDLIYGNGTVQSVYDLSRMTVGTLSFNVE
jgi:hypothetical protein